MLLTLLKNGVMGPMLINMLLTQLGFISPTLPKIVVLGDNKYFY